MTRDKRPQLSGQNKTDLMPNSTSCKRWDTLVFLTINGRRRYLWRTVNQDDTAQRFLSAYGPIAPHFRPRRHLLSASAYRKEMRNRFELNNVTRPQRRAKPAGQWDVAGEGGRGSTTAWCLNLQRRASGGVR